MLPLCLLYVFVIFRLSSCTNCRKEFHYHERYGYGYDVYCEHLNDDSISELRDVVVYNEVKLVVNSSELNDPEIFGNLHKLREIDIVDSKLRGFDRPSFTSLPNLRTLRIDATEATFNETFAQLDNLDELYLRNDSIGELPKRTFVGLVNLKLLNLNENYVQVIDDVPICELPRLKKLYVQYNTIARKPDLDCLTQLEELYLDFNAIEKLEFSNPNLKILSVGYNNVDALRLVGLRSLTDLNLEGNQLDQVGVEDFANLTALRNINLNFNKIKTLSAIFVPGLRELNLEGNEITAMDAPPESIESINLRKNKLTALDIFANLANLKSLNVADNDVKEFKNRALENTSLTFLDLSHNLCRLRDASFHGLFKLQELNLSGNNLTVISETAFVDLRNLERLSLSQNKLRDLGDEFSNLVGLKVLNISYNQLEDLRHDYFRNLAHLNVLDVEGNQLKSIEYILIISELHSLRAINVKGNLLSCEFLSEMIQYFRGNRINYTISEEFKYDRENVAGIYCKETASKLNESLFKARAALDNNTQILRALYDLTKVNNENYDNALHDSIVYIVVVVTVAFLLIVAAVYKLYMHFKRRDYLTDELELIDTQKR